MEKIHIKIRAADASLSWFDILSDAEKVRAESMHEGARPSFVTARALLRIELGVILDKAPETIRLHQEGTGVVQLLDTRADGGPYFSVSHTGSAEQGIAAVAVSEHNPIGIDIELPDREVDFMRLAERRYPESDYTELQKMDPLDARIRFYELWTLREALVKLEDGKLMPYLKTVEINMRGGLPALKTATPAGQKDPLLFCHYYEGAELMIGVVARDNAIVCLDVNLEDAYRYEPFFETPLGVSGLAASP